MIFVEHRTFKSHNVVTLKPDSLPSPGFVVFFIVVVWELFYFYYCFFDVIVCL